jgi:hypothetical protein
MNERILNLLSLCIQAQEKGFHLKFELSNSNERKLLDVWHFGRDNGQLFIVSHIADIDEAETYLKELIA